MGYIRNKVYTLNYSICIFTYAAARYLHTSNKMFLNSFLKESYLQFCIKGKKVHLPTPTSVYIIAGMRVEVGG